MKILILGSEGTIGSALCKHLKKCGHTVIHWDIKISREHDLSNDTNTGRLKDIVDASDFIFFLAYDVGGAKYIWDVDVDFINRNTKIMLNTFNLLKSKQFIFASSTMYNMNNPYGALKNLGEHYTEVLQGLSVRFWNVYGKEEVSSKSHVITDMIHKWKTKGHIDLITDGEEERQFLHTDDCAVCLTAIMNSYEDIIKTEKSVDITSFEWVKIKDVAKLISTNIKPGAKRMDTHDRRNEPREFILKYWKPEISLHQGIASLLQYSSDHTSSSTPVSPTC